jgi:hypothetical protein
MRHHDYDWDFTMAEVPILPYFKETELSFFQSEIKSLIKEDKRETFCGRNCRV